MGRYVEKSGDFGRDRARLYEIRVRYGEIWGDMGRYGVDMGEIWGEIVEIGGEVRVTIDEKCVSYNYRLSYNCSKG